VVGASEDEVRRGEEVEAVVTIPAVGGVSNVEVGLVCTEYYDEETSYTDGQGHARTSRTTAEAIAHEAWLPLESARGVQRVRFAIPAEAPFSYEGDCLSFRWEVVARARRRRRLDALARHEISVPP
jgi:hypothetical protein